MTDLVRAGQGSSDAEGELVEGVNIKGLENFEI